MALRESRKSGQPEPLSSNTSNNAENKQLRQRVAALEQELALCMCQRDEAVRALQDAVQERERYRLISELVADYAYVLRVRPGQPPDWEWITETFVKTTGYTMDELLARNELTALFHVDDMPTIQARHKCLLQGQPDVSEFRIVTRNGTTRWIREYSFPEWDEAQSCVIRIYGAAQDITEHKEALEALRESERRYRTIITTMRDGVILHDRDGAIREWNDRAKTMLGRTTEKLMGLQSVDSNWRAIHADGTPFAGINHPTLVALRTGKPCSNVVMGIYQPDGSLHWVLINAQPLFRQDTPAPTGVVATFTDITELKRAEEAYRVLVEHSLQALVIFQDNQVKFANAAAAAITGYSIEELHALTPEQIDTILMPAERDTIRERIQARFEGQVLESLSRIHMQRRDGEVRVLENSAVLTHYQGKPAIQGTFIDITERVRAEESLRESEKRYRTLVETSPSAILLTDLDGTIRFGNQQTARLFLLESVEQLYGRRCADLGAQDNLMPDPLMYAYQIVGSGNIRNIEYMMARSDGTTFVAEVNSSVVTDHRGEPTALIVVIDDISARKQAERELTRAYADLAALNEHLRHSRNLLHAVVNGLDDGLALLNNLGAVQMINQSLATLLDTPSEKLVGQPWFALLALLRNESWNGESIGWVGELATGTLERRVRYRSPDSMIHVLDVKYLYLQGFSQVAEQVIVHVVDVTETVQLQARVIENERFAASGKLAASVAHEINTPLQALLNSLGLVRRVESDTERDTFLVQAMHEIQRVSRILHQLLDLYRPAANKPGSVDINSLIERLLILIGKQLKDQRVTIACDLAPHLPPIAGRPDDITQVLLNLMMNALDAMPDGGTLRVCTGITGTSRCHHSELSHDAPPPELASTHLPASLEVLISDTGTGIHPELQGRIFEPFVTTKEQGTGLGLAICAQIVNQHGGVLSVVSRPGKGSTFTLALPLS